MSTALKTLPGKANAAIFKSPLDTEPSETFVFPAGVTVNQWLDDSKFRELLYLHPCLVLLNNVALLEAEWDTVIEEHDCITLVPQPFELVIGTVLFWIGFAITAASAAYALYLALTIDTPDAGDEAQSSTYNISYRGNSKRPGQPIPVAYGVCRVYPDLSSETWSEFDENGDITQVMLFEFTQGTADVTAARFGETPLTSYTDVEAEVLQPGQVSTLYPSTVVNEPNVQNIELDITYSTAYFVCDTGQSVGYIYIDFSAPQGLWTRSETTGRYFSHLVNITISLRIEGGSWTDVLAVAPYSLNPWRGTKKIQIPVPGRYEVKVRRNHPRINEARTADKVYWTGLRAFLLPTAAPDTTRVAIRIRATDQVGNLALSQFSGVCHRMLPRYVGPGPQDWTGPELTTSAVWAFCDACIAEYGGKRPQEYLDLDALLAIEAAYGSTTSFNGIFETQIPLWQALQEISRSILGRPIEQPGGKYTMVPDVQAANPSAMYTAASIVDGSFRLEHVGYTSASNDSVTVTFKDEAQEYRDTSITLVPSGSAGTNPAERALRGTTDVIQAANIGWRMANENRYRRVSATWRTGIEGYIPTYGDTVRVQSWMLGKDLGATTLSGSIVSRSGSTMYVHEDLSGIGGSGVCFLISSGGGVQGPLSCTVSSNSFTASSADLNPITFPDNLQRPQFIVGRSSDFVSMVKLTGVQNVGEHVYELTGFLDNPNAYIQGEDPTKTSLGDAEDLSPKIEDLRYTLDRLTGGYDLRLSWREINVDRSQVEQSDDNGATWYIITEQAHQYHMISGMDTTLVDSGNLWFRVTGFNIGAGTPVSINIGSQAYVVDPPTGVTVVTTQANFRWAWDATPMPNRFKLDLWFAGSLQRSQIVENSVLGATYHWDESVHDAPGTYLGSVNTIDGARDVTLHISVLDADDVESAVVQSPAHNDQIGALGYVSYWELLKGGLRIKYERPAATDFFGVEIHLSLTSGFTPDMSYPNSSTRAYAGPQDDITIAGVLQYPQTYYLKMAGLDKWGRDSLSWSNEETIYTTDGVTEGDIEWGDIIGPGKPDDGAQVNNPYPLGIKINTQTFGNAPSSGYFYIHGYRGGVAVDEPALMMCGNEMLSIPDDGTSGMMGFIQHTGRGYLAYDTTGTFFVVQGGAWKLAAVVISGGAWWYDNGTILVQWIPPAYGVWIVASFTSAGPYIATATPWPTGKAPDTVMEENYTYWDNIGARPTDEELLNLEQEWTDIHSIPPSVYNDNIVWDNLDDLINTGGRLYNEDTTWVNLGDVDTGTPTEILNENVLYAGLADAPNDSDIYNNLQTYDNLVGLKPPTGATQNGQRGLCWDADFGLSHTNGWAYYFDAFVNAATSVDAGENETAAAIIQNNGYIYPQKTPAKQGDRFYILARVKLSRTGLAPGHAIIYAEEYNKFGAEITGNIIGTSVATTNWQTITCVWDVDHPGTESIRFAPWLTVASGGDTMIVDSFDWWPITEKWTYPNIAYYIDNLAIREALIGNASIINLKVSGDALFLPEVFAWGGQPTYLSMNIPSGQSSQEANWITFANYWFDMDGMVSGQKIIINTAQSDYFMFKLDNYRDRVYVDVRLAINGAALKYFYQTDYYYKQNYDPSYVGNVGVNGVEYVFGHVTIHEAIDPNNVSSIVINDVAAPTAIPEANQIQLQFRVIAMDTSGNYLATGGDYKYGDARASFSGGRSS